MREDVVSGGITTTRCDHQIVPGDDTLSAGDSIPVDGSALVVDDSLVDNITSTDTPAVVLSSYLAAALLVTEITGYRPGTDRSVRPV